MYSNKIDLQNLFEDMPSKYCILKMSEDFPNYTTYSDIDVLCENPAVILQYCKDKRPKDFKIKVTKFADGIRTHIDYHYKNASRLDIKLDLITNLNVYKKIRLHDTFIPAVYENMLKRNNVYVPALEYEMVIRILEYTEHIKKRPDKIKHLKFINSQSKEVIQLYERLRSKYEIR